MRHIIFIHRIQRFFLFDPNNPTSGLKAQKRKKLFEARSELKLTGKIEKTKKK
jgi:hypothetical protein